MMSIYIESFLELHPGSKYLFTEDDDEKGPGRLKGRYTTCVRDNVWCTHEFKDLAPEAGPVDSRGWPPTLAPTAAASVRQSTPPIVVQRSLKLKYVAAGKARKEERSSSATLKSSKRLRTPE